MLLTLSICWHSRVMLGRTEANVMCLAEELRLKYIWLHKASHGQGLDVMCLIMN